MHTIRPNAARAKRVIILFIVSIVLWILRSSLFNQFLYKFSDDEQFTTGLHYMIVGANWAAGILAILLIIVYIQWFRRAYYNLQQIPGSKASYGEGMAAGAWFIPVFNLYGPYVIMKEIWVGTQNAVAHRIGTVASPAIVGFWWALYLIRIIYSLIVSQVLYTRYPATVINNWVFDLIACVMAVVPIGLAMLVVIRVSNFEKELWEESQTPSDSVFALEPGVTL